MVNSDVLLILSIIFSVTGSAFTKAKPKHGLLTVTRLAALRLFLLPFYYQWWICQTSSRIFIALLILYSVQLFNTFLYFSAWFPLDAAFNTLDVRDIVMYLCIYLSKYRSLFFLSVASFIDFFFHLCFVRVCECDVLRLKSLRRT